MNNELYFNLGETLSTADPNLHRVLIIGGGAAGLELATKLGNTVGRRRKASVTLLDKSCLHVWKPLLYKIALTGDIEVTLGQEHPLMGVLRLCLSGEESVTLSNQ